MQEQRQGRGQKLGGGEGRLHDTIRFEDIPTLDSSIWAACLQDAPWDDMVVRSASSLYRALTASNDFASRITIFPSFTTFFTGRYIYRSACYYSGAHSTHSARQLSIEDSLDGRGEGCFMI